jgi:hypothetical protein
MAISSELTLDAVLVPLRDGPAVPAGVIRWLLRAEDRGLVFRAEPDGRLHVGPREVVTPDDLAFVKARRDVVLACVAYIDRIAQEPL